jgi:hypothetical protein
MLSGIKREHAPILTKLYAFVVLGKTRNILLDNCINHQ